MTDILLIQPSSHWRNVNFPTGLFYLGSFLGNLSSINEIEILNLPTQVGIPLTEPGLEEYIKKTEKILEAKNLEYVGISCWTSNLFQSSILTAEIIKKINKNAIIAIGGYHPSVKPEDFKYKNSPIDYVIVGEGEIPFKEYVLKGKIQNDPVILKCNQPTDFDYYENLNWELLKDLQLSNFDLGSIYLSRGCPYNCTFCIERTKSSKYWRSLPPNKCILSIQDLCEQFPQLTTISIFDPIFGFEKSWRIKFLELLEKEKMEKNFFAEMRIDTVNKDTIQKLAKLNFLIFFGVESFSKTILSIMRKTRNPEKYTQSIIKVANLAEQFHLNWVCNLMLGHPGETHTTIEEFKDFLEKNLKGKRFVIPNLGLFCYFPGSHVANYLNEYEKDYGTQIYYPEWWKKPPLYNDFLFSLANRLDPSKSLNYKQLYTEYISLINFLKIMKRDLIDEIRLKDLKKAFKQVTYLIHKKDFLKGSDLTSIINKIGPHRHLLSYI